MFHFGDQSSKDIHETQGEPYHSETFLWVGTSRPRNLFLCHAMPWAKFSKPCHHIKSMTWHPCHNMTTMQWHEPLDVTHALTSNSCHDKNQWHDTHAMTWSLWHETPAMKPMLWHETHAPQASASKKCGIILSTIFHYIYIYILYIYILYYMYSI